MDRRDFLKTAGKSGLYLASGGLAFSLASCDFSKVFDPSWVTATEISPLPEFPQWWNEISSCSRSSGNFNRVRWFHVHGYFPCIIKEQLKNCEGVWQRPHDIYLSDNVFRLYDLGPEVEAARYEVKLVVKHEMLHDLLDTGKHTDIFKVCKVDIPLNGLIELKWVK